MHRNSAKERQNDVNHRENEKHINWLLYITKQFAKKIIIEPKQAFIVLPDGDLNHLIPMAATKMWICA